MTMAFEYLLRHVCVYSGYTVKTCSEGIFDQKIQ